MESGGSFPAMEARCGILNATTWFGNDNENFTVIHSCGIAKGKGILGIPFALSPISLPPFSLERHVMAKPIAVLRSA